MKLIVGIDIEGIRLGNDTIFPLNVAGLDMAAHAVAKIVGTGDRVYNLIAALFDR